MNKIFDLLKSQVPFELKRPSSLLSISIAIIFTGFLLQLGTRLLDSLFQFLTPYFPSIVKGLLYVFSYSFNVKLNLISIVLFIVIFFTVYRVVDRTLLGRLSNMKVFFDDFDFSNKGWLLNYWGSSNPDKTCHYEDSVLVFEAESDDLTSERKEYGAYYDLDTGIYEKNKYEVSCMVRTEKGTTMGIRLWVHDTRGHNGVKYPTNFYTPGESLEEIKVGYTGSASQALRIHLHIKPGKGKIYVDSVTVIKK